MRVVMYLRISSEDVDVMENGKTESFSIAHQRWLLTDFIRNHPDLHDADLDEVCDDGWSGRNFERPGVTMLLEQVRQGKVQCIVVKDFSRFGREYLTVGNYISRVFPFMGVRFISVNDGFDSTRPNDIDSLDTAFKTLIYDLYSRELSQKVKLAKRRRAEQGLFLSPFAPYGYRKDETNKNQLVVDEPAANVVRRIFRMALDGCGMRKIAATLNREGVMTPMQYKHSNGVKRKWPSIHEQNFWTDATIVKILRDEQYIGKTIYGKRVRTQIGHWHNEAASKDDWIVCENQHETLVSKEDFDAAQQAINPRSGFMLATKNDRPLRRKVFCGICGHAMERTSYHKALYRCRTHSYTDAYSCTGHGVGESVISDTILNTIRSYAKVAVRLDAVNAAQHEKNRQAQKNTGKKLIALQNEQLRLSGRLQQLYEAFVAGELSREKYLKQKSSIVEREQEISTEIAELESSAANNEKEQAEAIAKYIGYAEVEELTAEMINELVQRIEIYPGDVLEVKLNFADELEMLKQQLDEAI